MVFYTVQCSGHTASAVIMRTFEIALPISFMLTRSCGKCNDIKIIQHVHTAAGKGENCVFHRGPDLLLEEFHNNPIFA